MDRLAVMELFVRIVERRSFSAAAVSLGISRPVVSSAIRAAEQRLGARMLQRSTRHVQPTAEGEAYYQRCLVILADVEDAERPAAGAVTGLVHVDVAAYLARTVLLPALPAFLGKHPSLTVHLGEGERFVDLVREGVDCKTATWSFGVWASWRRSPAQAPAIWLRTEHPPLRMRSMGT